MKAYRAALERALSTLGTTPVIGRARNELRPGLRSHRVKQHVIFYQVDDSIVTIVRILYGRQDFAREFDELT